MAGKYDDGDRGEGFSSPPCFMHELAPDLAGVPIDLQQARDVARWRKAERERLIAARLALTQEERAAHAARIGRELDDIVLFDAQPIVSLYWPFRGEPDLRSWMTRACEKGARVALPVVVAKAQPLVFREWLPGARLERGIWNIPYPADGAIVVPNIVIAPLVGFDPACYRLGYGGGYFDRTLGALDPKPLAVGVGHPVAALATIFPQPYDIPMDWVVLGDGQPRRRPVSAPVQP